MMLKTVILVIVILCAGANGGCLRKVNHDENSTAILESGSLLGSDKDDLSLEYAKLYRLPVEHEEETFCVGPKPWKCEKMCSMCNQTEEIRAAVILPMNDSFLVSFNKVFPVLLMAEMEVHKQQLLPFRISFYQKEDRCDNTFAAYEAIKARYFEDVHVYFGPMCEYSVASVGRFLKFWSIPLLTAGAVSFDFTANKTTPNSEFHMLHRVGLLSFRPISHFILKIFDDPDKNWTKAVLIYEKNGYSNLFGPNTCHLMMSTLIEVEFKPRKQSGKFDYHYYDLESGKPDELKKDLREETNNRSTSKSLHYLLIACLGFPVAAPPPRRTAPHLQTAQRLASSVSREPSVSSPSNLGPSSLSQVPSFHFSFLPSLFRYSLHFLSSSSISQRLHGNGRAVKEHSSHCRWNRCKLPDLPFVWRSRQFLEVNFFRES